MTAEPLDALPIWVLLPVEVFGLWLALEVGYRAGAWRHVHAPGEKETEVGAMTASILGLLALLLGFTFNMAASRFDARRQGVLEEANAIGTTYLRARLLPQPERGEAERLLREYVAIRLEAGLGDLRGGIARSEKVHELLWEQGALASERAPTPITGLFVQSLNDVIDWHAKRIQLGVRNRVPFTIWLSLLGLSVVAMWSTGYQSGLSATRRSPAMFGLLLAFGVVLALITDLDRGHEGLLQVSQQAMQDVQNSMQSSSP